MTTRHAHWRNLAAIALSICGLLTFSACAAPGKANVPAKTSEALTEDSSSTARMTIDGTPFPVVWENNPSTSALRVRFPLALSMSDLHENEKYGRLSQPLPASPQPVHTIHTGDIMLYGDDTLVFFYKDFDTTYTYTRLGRIKDTELLRNSLGKGAISAAFEETPL